MRLRQRRDPMTDVQAHEDGRNGKHFGTNSSHRFQSEAHALSAPGEINPYSCPACKSENTQRLSTAYMSGLSHFSAVTSGLGWARARGTRPRQMDMQRRWPSGRFLEAPARTQVHRNVH